MKTASLLCAAFLLLLSAAGCGDDAKQPDQADPGVVKAEQEQRFRCSACGKIVKNSDIGRTSQTAGRCPECKRIAQMIPVK